MPVVTKQQLIDAATDAQTLEDVANGSDTATVTPRLGGDSINSVRKAIKALEDNGFIGNAMYADTTAGIAGTSDGQLFTIPGTGAANALEIWENDNGTAVNTGKVIGDAANLQSQIDGVSALDKVIGQTASFGDASKVVDISSFSYTNSPTPFLSFRSDHSGHIGVTTASSVTVHFSQFGGSGETITFDLLLLNND